MAELNPLRVIPIIKSKERASRLSADVVALIIEKPHVAKAFQNILPPRAILSRRASDYGSIIETLKARGM